jgi:4'-phosphopantetheinyl transferase
MAREKPISRKAAKFAKGKKVSEKIFAGEESGQAGGEEPIATIKDATEASFSTSQSDSGPASLVWLAPPPSLALVSNEVHVWLVRADHATLCMVCCENLLGTAERERAARFKFEKDRRLYTVAHAALRSVLADYLILTPADLQFETGPRGKPRLAPTFRNDSLEFNLSHSSEVALIAVTRKREIGVDVEQVKKQFAFAEVAERYFTAKEVSAIRALPEGLQRRAFYQCWTSKEAFLKAKGVGLSGELDEVEILFGDKDRVQVKSTLSGWYLSELNPCDDYVGAVALEGDEYVLGRYQWPGPAQDASHAHP